MSAATPVSIIPTPSSTITSAAPILGGTIVASGTSLQRIQWQFSLNTSFTGPCPLYLEPSSNYRTSGARTIKPPIQSIWLTPNNTWYMRARAVDTLLVASPWTATFTYTVNVPDPAPPTGVLPANGATVSGTKPAFQATVPVDERGDNCNWYVSQDPAIVTGIKSIIGNRTAITGGIETVTHTAPFTTAEGLWYMKARTFTGDPITRFSTWTPITSFTVTIPPPPTPTLPASLNGATFTTSTPTLSATLTATADGRSQRVEYSIASDAAFTTLVTTYTEDVATAKTTTGLHTFNVPLASKIPQGTWYLRARALDQVGIFSDYSAAVTFTVAHAPAASATSPAASVGVQTVGGNLSFFWSFSDPWSQDSMTSYQVSVERNDTGASVYDSTKTAGTVTTHVVPPTGWVKDVLLRWRVRVWDQDDVQGIYSPYQMFTYSDPPTVTITAPTAAQVVGTGSPTITWTTDAATTQVSRQIVITDASTLQLVYDSGIVKTAVKTWTSPTTILSNNMAYVLTVTVTDALAMSTSASQSFSTSYPAPDNVTWSIDPTTYDSLGYVTLDWSSTQPDLSFVRWNVYRRFTGGSNFTLIYSTVDSTILTYHDWQATSGYSYDYAVTQVALRSGINIESAVIPSDSFYIESLHYWIINPYDETKNVRLNNVTSDSYTEVYDEAELHLIGRGRKKNLGTRFGVDGSLTAQLRDSPDLGPARLQRLRLVMIKDSKVTCFLRGPFGDLLQISIGNITYARIAGVGSSEFVDVTIPYQEVM